MTHAIDLKHQQPSKLKRFKKFVFVGSNSVDFINDTDRQLHLNPNNSLLAQARLGSAIAIEEIYASKSITRQLNNLGLKSGKIVRVISKTNNGSVIVASEATSVGIGTEIARQIVVSATKEIL